MYKNNQNCKNWISLLYQSKAEPTTGHCNIIFHKVCSVVINLSVNCCDKAVNCHGDSLNRKADKN